MKHFSPTRSSRIVTIHNGRNDWLLRMTATVEGAQSFHLIVSEATLNDAKIGASKAKPSAVAVVDLSFVRVVGYLIFPPQYFINERWSPTLLHDESVVTSRVEWYIPKNTPTPSSPTPAAVITVDQIRLWTRKGVRGLSGPRPLLVGRVSRHCCCCNMLLRPK